MKISKSFFVPSLILIALISSSALPADIDTVLNEGKTKLQTWADIFLYGILPTLCVISFVITIWKYKENKIPWEALPKEIVCTILIGGAAGIVTGLIKLFAS